MSDPAPVAASTRDAAGALIGMRRTLARNSPGGSGTVATLRVVGLALAVATLLCGLVRFEDPDRSVDLVAALMLGWLIGWVMGPILVRGAGVGLRAEWFALVPIPPGRLTAGLLGASFAGVAPAVALPHWRSVARNTLWTVGIVLVIPQGLVPIAFNLFGVDPQVRVWFAARYLPQGQQVLAAVGFIAAGLVAIWGAEAVARRPGKEGS